jgi:periplasmic protein TonB
MEAKKNPEVNLELKKGSFMWMGMLFAMAIVLVAFEWKIFDKVEGSMGDLQLELVEEEIIPQSIAVPPPPPPPPQATTVIEIVDDEEEIEDELELDDMEVDQDTEIEYIESTTEEVVEEEIFTIVEDMPSFPGGEEALFKYLGQNIKYPQLAKEAGITGKVYVNFVVDKDGNVTDVKVLRGIGGGCDEEAIRVVKNMPKWSPGKQRGKPVKVSYNLPIRFSLK